MVRTLCSHHVEMVMLTVQLGLNLVSGYGTLCHRILCWRLHCFALRHLKIHLIQSFLLQSAHFGHYYHSFYLLS